MTKIGLLASRVGTVAICSLSLYAAPAAAQATRTWVSGVGDDVNPCSRTAPCRTFAGSISKTAAGGEINCLDAGSFGAVTITKSISIICEDTEAGILASGTNGIIVNAATTDRVVLKGLDIVGAQTGIYGVRVIAVGALDMDDVRISGFSAGGSAAIRLDTAANTRLTVANTQMFDNAAGVSIAPTSASSVVAVFTDVKIANSSGTGFLFNTAGITSGTASSYVSLKGVTIANNVAGLAAVSPPSTANVVMTVADSEIVNNGPYGVLANGGGAQVRLSGSLITANTEGVRIAAGGVLLSYGDNLLYGNVTNGTFTSTLPKN